MPEILIRKGQFLKRSIGKVLMNIQTCSIVFKAETFDRSFKLAILLQTFNRLGIAKCDLIENFF